MKIEKKIEKMEEKKEELREKLGECYSISTKNELSLYIWYK